MRSITVLLLLVMCFASGLASAGQQPAPCKLPVHVLWFDTDLKNVDAGLSPEMQKWFTSKVQKKYPDVCYVAPSVFTPYMLFIEHGTSTYHGTREVSETNDAPITGKIDNGDGTSSKVTGTMSTTSTHTAPVTFRYGIWTLTVKRLSGSGSFEVVRSFQRDGIQRTMYGFAVSNRHPREALIEEAAKWMHENIHD